MTELPGELAGRTPEEVLAFLKESSDTELAEAVHGIGTPVVLALLFDGMAGRFAPKAGRRSSVMGFVLTDEGVEHRHALRIDDAGAQVTEPGAEARATLRCSVLGFLRIASGAADPKRMLLTGRLRVSGDVWWLATTLSGLSAPGPR